MKILIIGGGTIAGGTHIPQAIKNVGVENVILADPNINQLEKQVAKYGLLYTYSDYHDALGDADICIIATPPHIRNSILKDCIASGKHILAEKPLTPNSSETKVILNWVQKNQVIGVCHTYRLFNNRKYVRNLIQQGFFGEHPKIIIHEGSPFKWPTVTGYCVRKEMVPGGVLFDSGIHSLDFVYWCLGMPSSVSYVDDAMGGLESNCEMTFKFTSGAEAYLKLSRTMQLSNTIVIEGQGHTCSMEVFEHNSYVLDGKKKIVPEEPVSWDNISTIQMQNFLNAIAGKERICCPIEEGLEVIEMLEMCYAQKKIIHFKKNALGRLAGKKVFVTGGTGFIGGHIVEQLVLHENAKVRVLVHTWARAAYVSRFDVEFVQADLLSQKQIEEATKDCDYIIHASILGGRDHDEFVANNVRATDNIMAAAKANNIEFVVQFSSVVVHGKTLPDNLNADSPLISYGDTYADGKLEAEKRFWQLQKELEVNGCVLRPTYVWGPYSTWYTLYPLEQMRKKEFAWFNYGKGICNAVYVGNVVDLCITCLINPKANSEAFIAADTDEYDWYAFYSPLIKILGMKPTDFPSIPLNDSLWRTIRLAWKQHLWIINDKLSKKIEEVEPYKPITAKLLYRLPRRCFRMIRNIVSYRLPEMQPNQMAVYTQSKKIDVQKNTDFLGFSPRYTMEQGIELTKKWLLFSDIFG